MLFLLGDDIIRIFLITGKAGCGKNEVAKILSNELDNAVITSLSKYIKLFALELTNWDGNEESKPREFLQKMGDNLRNIDNSFLTKRLLEDIEVYKSVGIKNVIISDVRLVDEINYFSSVNDIDVYTIRVNSSFSNRKLTNSEMNHITEIELDNYDKFDYVIKNQFNQSLKDEVKKVLEGLK